MKELFLFLRKFHAYAGNRLYLNLAGMVMISLIEGAGIYMLVPMLSVVGGFSFDISGIPLLNRLAEQAERIADAYRLPLILLIYAALIVSQALLVRMQQNQNSRINQGFIAALRMDIYRQLLASKWHFFVKKRKSDFNHILTTELARAAAGTVQIMNFLTSVVFTVIQITVALMLSPALTFLVLFCGAVFLFFSRHFVKRAKLLGGRMTDLSKGYFAAVSDSFNGIKDIKSNQLETTHMNWFGKLNRQMEENGNLFTRNQSLSQFYYKVTSVFLIVAFVIISYEVLHAKTEQLVIIILIFTRLWPRFTALQNSVEQMMSAVPAYRGLIELQQECAEAREGLVDPTKAREEAFLLRNSIVFQDVSFRFNRDEPQFALADINLKIPVNRTTAIVGRSGAGKSTLIDILTGLFQPETGTVLVDGAPLTGEILSAFRKSISYVPQDPFLFNASIRDNLMMVAPEAGEEELWEALSFAAAIDFVQKLPQGIDTLLGDRGVRLSGGERQRIVLARAILRKPSVLVLDEATSALDNENEYRIQNALDRLKGSLTIIVIAHRLTSIHNADQVIVLDKGTIIQQGEYRQLSSEKRGLFSQLLSRQAEAL